MTSPVVSDEQLDELTVKLSVQDFRSARHLMYAVIGEVRASRAREAQVQAVADEWEREAEKAEDRFDEFRRVAVDVRKKLVVERDRLRHEVETLDDYICDLTMRPDTLVPPALKAHLNRYIDRRRVRAALIGTGDGE